MGEIQPQLTYSPEGTLTIQHSETEVSEYVASSRWGDFMNIGAIEDKRKRALELISGLPGVEVEEGEAPKIILPVHEALEEPLADNKDEDIENFLNAVFFPNPS